MGWAGELHHHSMLNFAAKFYFCVLFQSRKPNVLGLQCRMYLQLLKDAMPKKSERSLSTQHAALTDALTGRTVLLAIDGVETVIILSTNPDWQTWFQIVGM